MRNRTERPGFDEAQVEQLLLEGYGSLKYCPNGELQHEPFLTDVLSQHGFTESFTGAFRRAFIHSSGWVVKVPRSLFSERQSVQMRQEKFLADLFSHYRRISRYFPKISWLNGSAAYGFTVAPEYYVEDWQEDGWGNLKEGFSARTRKEIYKVAYRLGLSDVHSGNYRVDVDGHPVMIDFGFGSDPATMKRWSSQGTRRCPSAALASVVL